MIVLTPPPLSLPDDAPSLQELGLECGSYDFRDEAILGTRMLISLVARNYSDAKAAALDVRTEVDRLNGILSGHDSSSELSVLNGSRTHRASPELFAVVAAAERWRVESGGAFSGRLGRVIDAWQEALNQTPSRTELALLARRADEAYVGLDVSTHTIERPDEVVFALDALAKGWIVDRAFELARSSPGVTGALVDIGGDIRCGGRSPNARQWTIGIPRPAPAQDNAPLISTTLLTNHAIATSGLGPRDRVIAGDLYSSTFSPRNGWPVDTVSVTAIAKTAADADATATALLAMPTRDAIAWANQRGISARIVARNAAMLTQAAQSPSRDPSGVRFVAVKTPPPKPKEDKVGAWPKDWAALMTFTAPPRQLRRDENFRSPYMAMWITDLDNKPIRTLLLVGTHNDWQKDNYIWWAMHADNNQKLVATRSMSTSGSGIYKVLWDGTDDQWNPVPAGTYVVHVETSRERGKHTHRSLELDFSKPQPFTADIPSTEEAGGLNIHFYHP